MNVRAALLAGVVAGIVSTLAQLALWASFTDALPGILWRDTRLAAAIVLGRAALDDSPAIDAPRLASAGAVHFALSIVYAFVVARLVAGRAAPVAMGIGIAFGLALYALNMHGFTLIFPWFAVARDWITVAAHVVFGLSAALAYRAAARGLPR
jgi:hypothetical protein